MAGQYSRNIDGNDGLFSHGFRLDPDFLSANIFTREMEYQC